MADGRWRIRDLRAYVVEGSVAKATDAPKGGHWRADDPMANVMSVHNAYAGARTDWGIDVIGNLHVEVEGEDGQVGIATGQGGVPACFLIEKMFRRFVVGSDVRDIARMWDQMFRSIGFNHGRSGLSIYALSVVDLALWDLLGLRRGEPVAKMIGGHVRDALPCYLTGPDPLAAKRLGFTGAKLTLPYSPLAAGADGHRALARNLDYVRGWRDKVGAGFPLKIDCWSALDVRSAIDFITAAREVNLYWFEEVLHPDDVDGFRLIRQACPWARLTTGEHHHTRYGHRRLIAERLVDIVQPDLRWGGGMTEILRIAALANAFDIPVIPHGGSSYTYAFAATQPTTPFVEYISPSARGDTIEPVMGELFEGEPLPEQGLIHLSEAPGWGLTFRRDRLEQSGARLVRPYPAAG
ncbi:MAG: enolase C-terminal domain-like protein [Alphaproteobacteria bacterium]